MAFEAHCIVEIMGHQVIAGKVSEETHFGAPLMRVDVPKTSKCEAFTVYYGGGAIYKITPTTEEITRAFVEKQDPEPVKPYMLALPTLAGKVDGVGYPTRAFEEDEDDWDDYNPPDEDDPDDFDDDEDEDEYDLADDVKVSFDAIHRDQTKKAIAEQMRKLLADGFVVVDTETTGFGSEDEVIQIGILDHTGAVLLNSFIKPTQPIPNSDYHGITDEMVKDAPGFSDMFVKILEAIAGKTFVAYNFAYDSKMLDGDCTRHGHARIGYQAPVCAMLKYADFYGEWDEYHGNNRWQKLGIACEREGIVVEEKEHSAIGDCKRTLELIKKMAAWQPEKSAEKLNEIPF